MGHWIRGSQHPLWLLARACLFSWGCTHLLWGTHLLCIHLCGAHSFMHGPIGLLKDASIHAGASMHTERVALWKAWCRSKSACPPLQSFSTWATGEACQAQLKCCLF